MEGRVEALERWVERWTSEQKKVNAELKNSIQELKEDIKEWLGMSKKCERSSEKSENPINGGRREEREEQSDDSEEKEENLQVMILAENEGEEDETIGEESKENEELENKGMELSLFSIWGLTPTNTMKLSGWIKGREVLILIDSGASHNFLSSKLAADLDLMVEDTRPYCVKLRDGHQKVIRGCCKDIKVQIENYAVTETFFIFELGGIDLILGMAWLATLGEVKVNWRTLTMNFDWRGQWVQIQGDHALAKKVVTPQALLKETEIEVVTLLWELAANKGSSEKGNMALTKGQTAEPEGILEEYSGLFRETQELSPRRPVDHRIPIKEGENSVNVRPYRYPHLLKTEIEKQVAEMLKMGIIRLVAFYLQRQDTIQIHPVFHVSQLKKAVGSYPIEKDLTEVLQSQSVVCIPSKVLDSRKLQHEGQGEPIQQVLIQWYTEGLEAATWEDVSTMTYQFPNFNLEDKVIYPAVRQIGQVAFIIKLPTTARIHPVFHVSQLKKAIGSHPVTPDLPEDLQGHTAVCLPYKMLDRRLVQQEGQQDSVQQVLVQWQNGEPETAT